jgi:hypothetical protein
MPEEANPLWEILKDLGAGPITAIILAAIWIGNKYYPIYKQHVVALQDDIRLRASNILVLKMVVEIIKGKDHAPNIPDYLESYLRKGDD